MLHHRGRSRDSFGITEMPLSTSTISDPRSKDPTPCDNPRRTPNLKFFSSSATSQPRQTQDDQKAWTAEYLKDLRSNRLARPSGSRPFPGRKSASMSSATLEPPLRTASALSRPLCSTHQTSPDLQPITDRPANLSSHRRAQSALPALVDDREGLIPGSSSTAISNDMTSSMATADKAGASEETIADIPYMERGQRWMEKQEARSLRAALEVMDARTEQRLQEAAQDEASDLVWKHQSPGVPYKNPDVPFDLKSHLRKGSHARSLSTEPYASIGVRKKGITESTRSTSDGSLNSKNSSSGSRVSSGSSQCGPTKIEEPPEVQEKSTMEWDSPKRKSYLNMTFPVPPISIFSGHRRISGPKLRKASAEARQSLFRNPKDQIYEEPEDMNATTVHPLPVEKPLPLKPKARNLSATFKGVNAKLEALSTITIQPDKKVSKYDIHKNPPSQSRNPSYLRNNAPTPPLKVSKSSDGTQPPDEPTSSAGGIEVRGEDIRAATSMKLKDRSPKLPTPTVVSDRPGRPIVSFDRNYRPREIELKEEHSDLSRPSSRDGSARILPLAPLKPRLPPSTASAPMIPTINVSESPSIQVNDMPSTPAINIPEIPSISITPDLPVITISSEIPSISARNEPASSTRPLPSPSNTLPSPRGHRPAPLHSATAPASTTPSHWSPAAHRATAQCSACALPIAGRIVSALSQRFHPACFSCHQCGELLECVAFYPEPTPFRDARLARITARLNNLPIPDSEATHTEDEDGDSSLRFFCHLDFHEKFSPRCRSCKTPIEGEVILACGGDWHVGHFFCAECGDPFDAKTPFVEKDGFAWCVGCHCNRFSGKCAGCRRPITETVVKALGREWHEGCFCCKVCFTLRLMEVVRRG